MLPEQFAGWQLDLAVDDEHAYAALTADVIWNGYGIADLVPPYRAYTQVAVARHREDARQATCVILRHPVFNAIISAGDGDGLAALLAAVDLPTTAMLMVPVPLLPSIERFWQFTTGPLAMVRMQVERASLRPHPDWATIATRMAAADVPDLQAFYAEHCGQHFTTEQVTEGPFFGMRQDGRIVAGGGTHAMAARYGIAAIGNILTHPSVRGRGYASAITSAVTATLLAEGCATVILNVVASNTVARRLYQRLGYLDYCDFWEGMGERR